MNNLKRLTAAAVMMLTVALAGPAYSACNDGKDRKVTVINDTSFTITRLYGSNVGESDWQEDVLGSDVLKPGGKVTVNFDDGTCFCNFDLKAVFSDDTETIRNAFNVCSSGSWTIHE